MPSSPPVRRPGRLSPRHAVARALIAGALLVGLAAGAPATAKGGEIGGSGQLYLFSDDLGTVASRQLVYGTVLDRVVAGDWDGDGRDTLAVRRGRHVLLQERPVGR
ncbi:hypothetical protein [Georgenia sp. SUBG003]|uniref:hypothetical protein n=1 Tax=Georgenia sp. SUBG003 TaxID=1497974 RepID=UPI003AB6EDBE